MTTFIVNFLNVTNLLKLLSCLIGFLIEVCWWLFKNTTYEILGICDCIQKKLFHFHPMMGNGTFGQTWSHTFGAKTCRSGHLPWSVFYNLCFIVFHLVCWLIYWMVTSHFNIKGRCILVCVLNTFLISVYLKSVFQSNRSKATIVPMHKICNNMSVKDYKPMSLSKFWACYAWTGVSLCQVSIDSHYSITRISGPCHILQVLSGVLEDLSLCPHSSIYFYQWLL